MNTQTTPIKKGEIPFDLFETPRFPESSFRSCQQWEELCQLDFIANQNPSNF